MSYVSGEPVPPGFEDEISRTVIIQKHIVDYNEGALIGTEYAVELHEEDQMRADYFCVLCNTCNDRRSIFIHWTSMAHRNNYLKTHFQKAFEVLQQFRRNTSNSTDPINKITTKLVQAIESHYGRSVDVLAISGEDFRRFRSKVCSQVRDKFHFDECAGPDFVDEVHQLIHELKQNGGIKITFSSGNPEPTVLDPISSDDDDDDANFIIVQPQKQQQTSTKKQRKKQEEQQPAYRAANRSPPLADKNAKGGSMGSTGGSGIKQTLPTPKELSLQASHIAQERYKWEKFRCLLELQLKQLRDETETYESNPEKHPDYSEEWKQFWNRRYKQLQEEKKVDPNNYDYKPEWISYWKDRRVELFNLSVNKIKKDLKEKFKLTDEDEENTKELMERYKIRVSSPKNTANSTAGCPNPSGRRKAIYRGNNNRPDTDSMSDAVIDISDDEQQAPIAPPSRPNRRPPYGRSMSGSLSPKRGRRPISRTSRRSRTRSPMSSRRRGRSRSRLRSRSRSVHRRSRTPYSRTRDHSHDFGERDRERGRDRGNSDYYRDRDRADSYSRSTRNQEPMETFRVMDSRVYPEYSQPGKRSISPTGTAITTTGVKEPELAEEADTPLTVVSVLRMLSALEDHLGSLGPKALNLLSKALAMEKVKPNAADELLLNEDICVFMETTKEKLKGILIAEVLDDPQKVRVVKKLISNIASIIFQVTNKGAKDAAKNEQKHGELGKKEYQLPFERQVVCSKLANALIMNGLDDISTEDMNRLLHFFTLLVKTNHTRRQIDRNSGLSFAETRLRLGFSAESASDNTGGGNDLDIDLSELIKEVESQLAEEAAESLSNSKNNIPESNNGMESLTDSDLQTLLQNFKFLSNEEQVHLIGHLRKLEILEPSRVERLRKYVNIAELSSDGESCSDYLSRVVNIVRPGNERGGPASSSGTASRLPATVATGVRRKSVERDNMSTSAKLQRRTNTRNSPTFIIDDDDDDDYNFDDLVLKATDPNGKKLNALGALSSGSSSNNSNSVPIVPVQSSPNALTFKPAASKISLKDTENIIANLMGTLANNQAANAAKVQQQYQQQQQMRNIGHNMMQQQRQQQQQPFATNNSNNNNSGYLYYGSNDQMSSMQQQKSQQQQPQQHQQQQQQQQQLQRTPAQQQQQQSPYQLSNYNTFGPTMGSGSGYGGQMNPWANGPTQSYNNMQQNFMQQQQQQQQPQHYNNMFGGH